MSDAFDCRYLLHCMQADTGNKAYFLYIICIHTMMYNQPVLKVPFNANQPTSHVKSGSHIPLHIHDSGTYTETIHLETETLFFKLGYNWH